MNKLGQFNYYEILEIPVNASSFEIRRAYRNALQVYSDHSLLTYSLFSVEERVNILKNIEDAYDTLIDRTKRTRYDAWLIDKSSDTNIQQDHNLLLTGHNGRHRMDPTSFVTGACPAAGNAPETEVTSHSIPKETGAENSLISKDRGSQKSPHDKSIEITDSSLAPSFWRQVSSKIVVIIALLGVTLVALSAILDRLDPAGRYFLHSAPGESHLEATAKQVEVEETDLWDRKDMVKEKPENSDDKALMAPESIASTENLADVYENIATIANIRSRPTTDSRIIARIPRGEEINVIGKDGEWTMLKLDDGSIGWIHRSLIRKKPTNTDS